MEEPSKELQSAFELSHEIAMLKPDWEDAENSHEAFGVLSRIRNKAARLRDILSKILQKE